MRINKYLALCGVASRRKSEELVLSGKVKVNGEVIRELSADVDERNDRVSVNGKAVKPSSDGFVYYMLNKPAGVISAVSSDHGDVTVVDLIKDEKRRIFPVGRLDKDSEGLIFLTNDGDFAYKLTHPKFEKKKIYSVLLKGEVEYKDIKKLSHGVVLDGKPAAARKVLIKRIENGNSLLEITISEGRNRQIRRMCEVIGHPVIKLLRVQEGDIKLGKLKSGEYRQLTKEELAKCTSDLTPKTEKKFTK